MVSVFLGKWEVTSSENFDEFLKAVGFESVSDSPSLPPTPSTVEVKSSLEFIEADGKIRHTSVGSKGRIELNYKLGEEFEQPLPHDENVTTKNMVTLEEDGKLVHKVSIGPKEILTTHEVIVEELVVKYEAEYVVGVRKFKKIA